MKATSKIVTVYNLSNNDESSYTCNSKEALISEFISKTYGTTAISNNRFRDEIESKIIYGNKSMSLGDYAILN